MINDEPVNLNIGNMTGDVFKKAERSDNFPPLPAGQSSPCCPIELDATTGLRGNILKKSVNSIEGTCARDAEITPRIVDPYIVLLPLPLATVKEETSHKHVTFSKCVLFKEVRHLNDYKKEEVEAIWLTMPDYLTIKATLRRTLAIMMQGEQISEKDEDFCTRGLETRTKTGAKARSRARLRTRSAVLNEQDMQREEGFVDLQNLALASMEETASSRAHAHAIALEDERCVQDYLADTRSLVGTYASKFYQYQ